jgi:hypothetical protein
MRLRVEPWFVMLTPMKPAAVRVIICVIIRAVNATLVFAEIGARNLMLLAPVRSSVEQKRCRAGFDVPVRAVGEEVALTIWMQRHRGARRLCSARSFASASLWQRLALRRRIVQ